MVALYWISNPRKSWKIFVANRVKKIAQVSGEVAICTQLRIEKERQGPLSKEEIMNARDH